VLGRLGETLVTAFAGGLEPHGLEPSAHREPFVESQPDEGSHFAGTGVVPDPSDNLGGCRVAEAQTLDEVDDSEGGGVATLALARDQGKGVARVRAKRKPGSHIKTPGSARKCE
jgi:hypothetical protein